MDYAYKIHGLRAPHCDADFIDIPIIFIELLWPLADAEEIPAGCV